MILVIVGTNYFSFDRLIRYCDSVLGKKFKVVIQTGCSKYKCENSEQHSFLGNDLMQIYLSQADCVIAHGGYGIITECIKREKRLLVVPRQKELRECLDDQFEIAEYFQSIGVIEVVTDEKLLLQEILIDRNPRLAISAFFAQQNELPLIEDIVLKEVERYDAQ